MGGPKYVLLRRRRARRGQRRFKIENTAAATLVSRGQTWERIVAAGARQGGDGRANSPTDRAVAETVSTWHGAGRLPRHCRLRQGRDRELARLHGNSRSRATD